MADAQKHCYHFEGEREMFSPQLIYYLDTIEENLRRAIDMAGGAGRLWPHIKTYKMPEMVRLLGTYGVTRCKCATIAEAQMAAMAGAQHILLSYPLVGPNIQRYITLQETCPETQFLAVGDDIRLLTALSHAAQVHNAKVRFMIDMNMGMNRTGAGMEKALALAADAAQLPNMIYSGLHCYDGHRKEKDAAERKREAAGSLNEILQVTEKLKEAGLNGVTVLGGTPGFPCYCELGKELENTFFSPGTLFVHDAGYAESFPDLPFEPAAAVLCRVISTPLPGRFTLDLGYKAISCDNPVKSGVIAGFPHAHPAFQCEEHWIWDMEEGYEALCPEPGEELYVIPWHICPTTALYSEVPVISHGRITQTWHVTARDRRLTI